MFVEQIIFIDHGAEELGETGGILVDDTYIICGECGGVLLVEDEEIEIIHHFSKWASIDEAIRG